MADQDQAAALLIDEDHADIFARETITLADSKDTEALFVVVYTLQALRPVHSFRSQCIVPDTVRLP